MCFCCLNDEDIFSQNKYFSAPPNSVPFNFWSAEQMQLMLKGESLFLFLACKSGVCLVTI